MGFNYAPPPTLMAPKGLIAGNTISALGDSISSQGSYFPVGTPLTGVPAWNALTVYGAGNLVVSGGLLYRCTLAGTSAASGGPTGQASSGIADGSAAWAYLPNAQIRSHWSYLHWVEAFSLGALKWNMAQGYAGIAGSFLKVLIVASGAGYAQGEAVAWLNGAKGYLNVTGGVVTSVTLTNPGYVSGSGFGSYTITTAGGSGCLLSGVSQVAGTFGVPGCTTNDMVARLPDCVASTVDIFVVHGGTNDVTGNASYATITANLKLCYETLVGAGKRVVAMPILPRSLATDTTAQLQVLSRVNKWIRAYCRREIWANPNQVLVYLADPTRYFTDGTSTTGKPIGAAAAANGAMTYDGLHPSPRGAQYAALAVLAALQGALSTSPAPYSRSASRSDGYHPTLNPGGNYIEAQPWTGSTAVSVGELRLNFTYIYICTGAGVTSTASPPTGTGSGIADGTAAWKYLRTAGSSVFGAGTKALPSSSGGYTISGVSDAGWSLYHAANGGATGSITGAIESPWSDGQVGQRQALTFALSGGTNIEQWGFYLTNLAWTANDGADLGILLADLGTTPFVFEVELEVSNLANVTGIAAMVQDNIGPYAFRFASGLGPYPGTASSMNLMNSASEMLPYPNGGKLLLRTDPFILPAPPVAISTLFLGLLFGFDPSTSAASLTVKINHASLRRAGRA